MTPSWPFEMYTRSSELTATMASILAEARWRARDVLSRRDLATALELLDAQAAELGLSPAARDQMLSLALTAAARDATARRDVLTVSPAIFVSYDDDLERARLMIRRQVFHNAPKNWSTALDSAMDFLHVLTKEVSGDAAEASRASRLQCELLMQELLWDHPHIPATPDTRLAMFFSVPVLKGSFDGIPIQQKRLEQAKQRTLHARSWSRGFMRGFRKLLPGRPPEIVGEQRAKDRLHVGTAVSRTIQVTHGKP